MAAGHEPSVVYLTYKDPSKMTRVVLWSNRSDDMNEQKDEFDKLPIIPKNKKTLLPKDYLTIELITDATDGIDYTDSYVRVPVTFKNLRTGQVFTDILSKAGDRKFTFLADASSFTAGVLQEWAYFQIPDGLAMKLGHDIAFNSRGLIAPYDDTA